MIGSGIFLLPASLAPYGLNSIAGWVLSAAGAIADAGKGASVFIPNAAEAASLFGTERFTKLVEIAADDLHVVKIELDFHIRPVDLRDEIGGSELGIRGVVGQHEQFARPGQQINRHVTHEQPFRRDDVGVAGTENLLRAANRLRPERHRRNGLRATDGVRTIALTAEGADWQVSKSTYFPRFGVALPNQKAVARFTGPAPHFRIEWS